MRKIPIILIATALLSSVAVASGIKLKGRVERSKKTSSDLSYGCFDKNLSGLFTNELVAYFEGMEIGLPQMAFDVTQPSNVLGVASEERWVEVDLSDQKLYAWNGDQLFLETPVSSGLPWYPTPTGEFRIWIKLRATKMEGGSGRYYYYLPNVPYVMYFGNDQVPNWKGYGLHGAYWHNEFGTQRSHGCVNLPIPAAEKLYYFLSPILPEGKSVVWADDSNPGARVVIHE